MKDDAAFDVLIRIMQKEVPRQKPVGYCEEGARMLKKILDEGLITFFVSY